MRVSSAVASAFLGALVACGLVVTAEQAPPTNVDRKGPQVGAHVPPFSGVDQLGRTQTLDSVLKADGAMLVFYRSADW